MSFTSCSFDLSDINAIPDLIKQLRKQFGPIYGLVNNAAIGTDGVLALMPTAQIEQLVRVNTISPIVLTKYVVRSMLSEGNGRIVNIASIIGFTGYRGLSVYGATKASMLGFTRSLAREVGRRGVNVNAVAPGFIDTEMTQGLRKSSGGKLRGAAPCNGCRKSQTLPARSSSCSATRPETSPERC